MAAERRRRACCGPGRDASTWPTEVLHAPSIAAIRCSGARCSIRGRCRSLRSMTDDLVRCWWSGADGARPDPLMVEYHDTEWGVPCHDDVELFERLALEGF